MSDIRQDVIAAAMRALMVPEREMVDSVARAILIERERCAQIAEERRAYYEGMGSYEPWDSGAESIAEEIRDAIRSGEQP